MDGGASEKARRKEVVLSDDTRLAGWVVGQNDRPSVLLIAGGGAGGMAALHAALNYPEVVTVLGLLATTAGGRGLTWPSDAFVAAATAGGGIFDQADAEDGLAEAVSERFRTERPALFNAMVEAAMTRQRSDLIGAAQATVFLTHDLAARLGEIQIPVLVMCGTEDQTHPPPNSQFLASNIPGAHLVVLEGAGHIIDAEDPQRVIDEIIRLVRRIAR